jgi:hypothetical protein
VPGSDRRRSPRPRDARFLQRRHGPVINDQNIDASESCEEVAQAAIGAARASSRSKAAARR